MSYNMTKKRDCIDTVSSMEKRILRIWVQDYIEILYVWLIFTLQIPIIEIRKILSKLL